MSKERWEPNGLSEEEVRELLREDLSELLQGEGAIPAARQPERELRDAGGTALSGGSEAVGALPAKRVLLVGRRGPDSNVISDRLKARGAVVEVVRNPFAALDELRTGAYGAVVSDLELWAGGGKLLFDRVAALKSEVALLFLVDRGRNEARVEQACRRRNCALLKRPFHPAELEGAIQELLEVAGKRRSPSGRPRSPGPEAPARASGAPLALPGEGEGQELPWLRFFLKSSRHLRAPGVDAGVLAQLAWEELRPETAGLLILGEHGSGGRLELRGGAEVTQVTQFREVLDACREGEEVNPARVAVSFKAPGARGWLVLLGIAPALRAAGEAYREDIRHLLSDWLGKRTGR